MSDRFYYLINIVCLKVDIIDADSKEEKSVESDVTKENAVKEEIKPVKEEKVEVPEPVKEEKVEELRSYFEEKGYSFIEASIQMVANDKITLNEDQLVTFNKMLDAFDDNDDVQDIYHNVELPEEEDED